MMLLLLLFFFILYMYSQSVIKCNTNCTWEKSCRYSGGKKLQVMLWTLSYFSHFAHVNQNKLFNIVMTTVKQCVTWVFSFLYFCFYGTNMRYSFRIWIKFLLHLTIMIWTCNLIVDIQINIIHSNKRILKSFKELVIK